MKILVTGADGQLGRCLQDRLALSGHDWTAWSRSELDITDAQAVVTKIASLSPDVIINAAAYTAVDKAESDEEAAWAINAQAVENLVTAANAVSAQLVHVSTDYVFDGRAETDYRETDPVSPLGVYGKSKLAGEEAAAKAERYLIVRTAWVFSEYGNNFLRTMLRLGAERNELSIVADQVGTPTYAGDLAAALLRMFESRVPSGVYHFSGGQSCSWYEFAQAIFHTAEKLTPSFFKPGLRPITTDEYPTVAKRPAFSVLDGSRLRTIVPDATGDWKSALSPVIQRVSGQN